MTRALTDIMDDDPITLAEASDIVLRGAITVATLRAEIKRGNLTVERIGKNLFTTPAYIRKMREQCRVQPNPRDSISERTVTGTSGLSGIATTTNELAVLKASVTALKRGSLSTLQKSTPASRQRAENPIPFPSRK